MNSTLTLRNAIVTPDDLTSRAELSFLYGDWQQAEAAALDAVAGAAQTPSNGNRESPAVTDFSST